MNTDETTEEQQVLPGVQQVRDGAAEIGTRVTELEHKAREVIRARPIVALLAALGAGFLAARLVSRGRR